jgi:hypothetical protein
MLGEYLTNSVLGIVHSEVDTYKFGTGLEGTPVEIAQSSGNDGIGLDSISCASATSCVAVGAQEGAEAETAVYLQETSGTWGSPTTLENPLDSSIPEEYLSSVSCVAVGDCVTAGDWLANSGNQFGETYTESSGTWGSAVEIGEPSDLNNPYVDAVSCVTVVTSCTISGALTDSEGGLVDATAQMTNGGWGQVAPAASPAGAINDEELLAISCTVGVQCTSVGYYDTPGDIGGSEAMAATWDPSIRPEAVTNLHLTARTGETVHLSWTAPISTGSGISHYEIDVFLQGGAGFDAGPASSTSATVASLKPGATYKLNVTTVATDGQTSAASSVIVHIPAVKPSAAAIRRIVGTKGGLRVYWSAPKSTGGDPITGYKVTAACHGTVHTDHFGGAALDGTVNGLGGGTVCTVRVYAINHVGVSPPSAPVRGKTLS